MQAGVEFQDVLVWFEYSLVSALMMKHFIRSNRIKPQETMYVVARDIMYNV